MDKIIKELGIHYVNMERKAILKGLEIDIVNYEELEDMNLNVLISLVYNEINRIRSKTRKLSKETLEFYLSVFYYYEIYLCYDNADNKLKCFLNDMTSHQ